MDIFKKDWLTSAPIDYELKYYRLKDSIKKLEDLISEGKLYSSMTITETELHYLYNIKYNRDSIESGTKIITGINIDTMDLDYTYPPSTEEEDKMYEICDLAISLLEDLYKTIRESWRRAESKCKISEIPETNPTKTRGFILYIDSTSEWIEVYQFVEPLNFKINWNDFKVKYVKNIENSIESISQFVIDSKKESNSNRFFRFSTNPTQYSKEDCMIPLMKYVLFNKIKH